jgi:hypothetical protein
MCRIVSGILYLKNSQGLTSRYRVYSMIRQNKKGAYLYCMSMLDYRPTSFPTAPEKLPHLPVHRITDPDPGFMTSYSLQVFYDALII